MKRKANKKIIGIFVVGAIGLFIAAIVIFGSGQLFKPSEKYVLFFEGSVKGLSEGAPVIFKGVKIGAVDKISLVGNESNSDFLIAVIIDVELSRVKGAPRQITASNYELLIKQGLRARLEVQNFITNQLMIAFDFFPDTEVKMYDISKQYRQLPTLPTSPDIFEVMDELPIKDIADRLDQTVAGINRLLDSEGIYAFGNAVKEVTQAARSLRLLAEYLEMHPEAILKGKQAEKGEDND